MSNPVSLKYQLHRSASGASPFTWSPCMWVVNTARMLPRGAPRLSSMSMSGAPQSMKYSEPLTSIMVQEQ